LFFCSHSLTGIKRHLEINIERHVEFLVAVSYYEAFSSGVSQCLWLLTFSNLFSSLTD